MNSSASHHQSAPPPAPSWKRSLITALCLFHMAAVVVFNLPQNTALGDLRAPLHWYARLSWLNQEWAMFTTIPHYVAIHPVLVAKYNDSGEAVYGPILPGLKPYPNDLRSVYLILHTLWASGEYRALAEGYLRNACAVIARQSGKKPHSVRLHVDAQVLAPLAQVRATRSLGRPQQQSSKAFRCR
ncbi:MAG: hypothetical protein QM778_38395 [Myxococcales bacterium]